MALQVNRRRRRRRRRIRKRRRIKNKKKECPCLLKITFHPPFRFLGILVFLTKLNPFLNVPLHAFTK